jgi:glycosyltransferase involved in cell wall biosynthesis
MRIGVDGGCWNNGRGYGRFTRELLRAMVSRASADDWVIFLDEQTADGFDLTGQGVRVVRVPQRQSPSRAAGADGYRSPADMLRLTRAVWRERPEVFFSPSVYTYFPLPPSQRAVVAIHDVIAERFPELTLPTQRARLFWRAKVGLALRQADLVVTVSDYSAAELMRVLGVRREKLRVVQPAPTDAYRGGSGAGEIAGAAARAGVPSGSRWFTYVGGFNPHKRVDRLVRAHARVARELAQDPPHLVLVGSTEGDVFYKNTREVRHAIDECGTGDLVHWAGYVADAELRHLHAGAIALVLVSEAEGFGLPAVEAAACGTPVIATTASPLPQVLEGGGLFVKPSDDVALVGAMLALARDAELRQTLGRNALEAAGRLTWERAADAALEALHTAAVRRDATVAPVIASRRGAVTSRAASV